jgi:hypothetical protein
MVTNPVLEKIFKRIIHTKVEERQSQKSSGKNKYHERNRLPHKNEESIKHV